MLKNKPLNEYLCTIHSHKRYTSIPSAEITKSSYLISCHNASLTSYTSCIFLLISLSIHHKHLMCSLLTNMVLSFLPLSFNILEFTNFILAILSIFSFCECLLMIQESADIEKTAKQQLSVVRTSFQYEMCTLFCIFLSEWTPYVCLL